MSDQQTGRSERHGGGKVRTGFPGAAAHAARFADGALHFSAPLHDSPRSMWWHLAVDHPPRPDLQCVWEHTEEVLGGGSLHAAVPVYRDGGRWRRVPARHCHYDADENTFRFRVPSREDEVELAYCYPYDMKRVEALLKQLEQVPATSIRYIAESEAGRPMPLIELGHGPFHVWLTARHHAGEVTGSWVLEGLLRRACLWPALLERLTIHAAPVMDLDGVAGGMYGKDRAPRDYNRDYVARPVRPEVAGLMRAVEWSGEAQVFIDLHAPVAGDCTFLVPTAESLVPADQWDRTMEFGRLLEHCAPDSCPFRLQDLHRTSLNWYGENIGQNATCYFQRRFGALAMTLEISYHRAWNRRLLHPPGWQALGRALLRAMAIHVGLQPTPDLSGIERPGSEVPRFEDWWCTGLPSGISLREHPASLELVGQNEQSWCWVMHKRLHRGAGKTGFAYRLQGKLEALQVTVRGWDSAKDLPTGDWENSTLPLKPTSRWQVMSLTHGQPEYLLMFRANGLQGKLQLRPTLQL